MPRSLRPSFAALWNLDLAFADAVSTTSDPHIGAIRLAWWRERLQDLGSGAAPPAEPRLQAAAAELLSRGIEGEELSLLEDAWLPALVPFPWDLAQADGFRLRGRILFGIGSRLLGAKPLLAECPGELWSLIDAAQHCSDRQSRDFLLDQARTVKVRAAVPSRLRALTIVTAVAVADAGGSKSRATRGLSAAAHRLTGRIPTLR